MPTRYLAAILTFALYTAALSTSCCPTGDCPREEIDPPAVAEPAQPESSTALPLLVVDTSQPLLLEEPTGTEPPSESANLTCLVCHANYTSEPLAATHLAADISCAKCHGDSIEHKNDENNTTPPEKMFHKDKIRAFCAGCHRPHRIKPAMIKERLDIPPRQVNTNDLVCTDCHGEHRMKVRTVIWNKKTGELLKTNRGD